MINLTGKSVFVKTQEEYLSILKNSKVSGIHMGERKPFKPYRNSISKHIEFLRR